jgi:LysM repeat protein
VPANAGICVVIDHGTHISIYAHLNRTDLNIGDLVKGGQVIGLSGSTGLSTGPHLHLEVVPRPINYRDGLYARRDPIAIIDASIAPIAPAVEAATSATMVGIDISKHQAGINVGATGAQFAIVKASEGVGYTDPQYPANIASARQAGARVGHYHLSRFGADAGNTPEAEAESFLKIVAPHIQDGDIVALDLELDDLSPHLSKRFLDIVSSRLSRKCLIYMNKSTASGAGWAEVAATYPLWLAWYPSTSPASWSPVAGLPSIGNWNIAIWQHADTGQLAGYNGNLDVNVFYGDGNAWNALATGKGFTPVAVTAPSAPAPKVPSNVLIVEEGDTFYEIAKQWNLDPVAFKAANPRKNIDLIFPGDILHMPTGTVAKARPATSAVSQCIVEKGDTFSGIAKQFGVDLAAFKAVNPGLNYERIFPGDVLNLPVAVAAPAKVSNVVTECIVEGGDTLDGIAKQFGVSVAQIMRLNPAVTNPNLIYPGQVLRLR